MGKVLDLENALPAIKSWAVGLFSTKADTIKNITRSGTTFTATRADNTTFTFTQQDNTVAKTSTTPLMDGTAAIGDETKYAAGNHVHPTDTSRAPLASPTFTGTPKAPTATAGTNTTQIATTAFTKTAIDNITQAFLGQGFGTCGTGANTAAKAVTLSNYNLKVGGFISVKFTYAVGANSTLNVNSKGAKPIFYRGSAIGDGVVGTGDTCTFVYDGTNYNLVAIDSDFTGVCHYIGTVNRGNQLPATGTVGDIYEIIDSGNIVMWTGSAWTVIKDGDAVTVEVETVGELPDVETHTYLQPLNYSASDPLRNRTEIYTKSDVDALLANWTIPDVMVYQGSVTNYDDLNNASIVPVKVKGDVYNVVNAHGDYPAGTNYAWNGTAWDPLGGSFVIEYATATEVTAVLTA